MGAGVGIAALVGVGTLLAILFGRGGGLGTGGGSGSGSGTGPGSTSPATQSLAATQPTRPLRVTIEGDNYVVNSRTVDLATVTDLASRVPPGDGVAVVIERPPTSRAKAEVDLTEALDKKGIRHGSE
jgi:hypothetical protein